MERLSSLAAFVSELKYLAPIRNAGVSNASGVKGGIRISHKLRAVGNFGFDRKSIFTAQHAMQTRSSDENSVRLSVRHTRVL